MQDVKVDEMINENDDEKNESTLRELLLRRKLKFPNCNAENCIRALEYQKNPESRMGQFVIQEFDDDFLNYKLEVNDFLRKHRMSGFEFPNDILYLVKNQGGNSFREKLINLLFSALNLDDHELLKEDNCKSFFILFMYLLLNDNECSMEGKYINVLYQFFVKFICVNNRKKYVCTLADMLVQIEVHDNSIIVNVFRRDGYQLLLFSYTVSDGDVTVSNKICAISADSLSAMVSYWRSKKTNPFSEECDPKLKDLHKHIYYLIFIELMICPHVIYKKSFILDETLMENIWKFYVLWNTKYKDIALKLPSHTFQLLNFSIGCLKLFLNNRTKVSSFNELWTILGKDYDNMFKNYSSTLDTEMKNTRFLQTWFFEPLCEEYRNFTLFHARRTVRVFIEALESISESYGSTHNRRACNISFRYEPLLLLECYPFYKRRGILDNPIGIRNSIYLPLPHTKNKALNILDKLINIFKNKKHTIDNEICEKKEDVPEQRGVEQDNDVKQLKMINNDATNETKKDTTDNEIRKKEGVFEQKCKEKIADLLTNTKKESDPSYVFMIAIKILIYFRCYNEKATVAQFSKYIEKHFTDKLSSLMQLIFAELLKLYPTSCDSLTDVFENEDISIDRINNKLKEGFSLNSILEDEALSQLAVWKDKDLYQCICPDNYSNNINTFVRKELKSTMLANSSGTDNVRNNYNNTNLKPSL